jgi:hypothetical protein
VNIRCRADGNDGDGDGDGDDEDSNGDGVGDGHYSTGSSETSRLPMSTSASKLPQT